MYNLVSHPITMTVIAHGYTLRNVLPAPIQLYSVKDAFCLMCQDSDFSILAIPWQANVKIHHKTYCYSAEGGIVEY